MLIVSRHSQRVSLIRHRCLATPLLLHGSNTRENMSQLQLSRGFYTFLGHNGIPIRKARQWRRVFDTAAVSGLIFAAYYSYYSNRVLNAESLDTKSQGREARTFIALDPTASNPYQQRKKELVMMSASEATKKLRANEESYFVNRGNGVWRYDTNQLASNDPIEDDRVEVCVEREKQGEIADWMFWGVFDGHSGWYTSDLLKRELVPFVTRQLDALPERSSSDRIDGAIENGFLQLDDEIIVKSVEKLQANPSKAAAADLLLPAMSGSCALLAFYDSKVKQLKVACTGDSRAVWGQRGADNKWVTTPLSVDQTGSNPDEAERIRSEHPGEADTAVSRGRVLGNLEPTRAFGDCRYKMTAELQRNIFERYFGTGRKSPNALKTPPYVTARPVVQSIDIDPEKGGFLILASDGLWEKLTNEEAVGLVARWLENHKLDQPKASTSLWDKWRKTEDIETIVHPSPNIQGQKLPDKKNSPKSFDYQDKNASTMLIRNCLGGKDEDTLCSFLSLPAPMSRYYRDDLTCTVIFFGKRDLNNNTIQVNPDAASSSSTNRVNIHKVTDSTWAKPKL